MKNTFTVILILISGWGWCQTYETNYEESVDTDGVNTVIVSNVYGSIEVRGSQGSQIDVSADVEMIGRNQAQLDRLINGISLGMERLSDTLLIYSKVEWLCDRYLCKNNCHFQWNSDKDGEFYFDFKVSLPEELNIETATVNDGDINIYDVSGRVSADNVNGSIHLEGVSNVVKASTINGQLTAQFDNAPTLAGRFFALNGDINSIFPSALSADIGFKSLNGEFFTDFDFAYDKTPAKLKVRNNGASTKYKLEDRSAITIGGGGVELSFETLNGNMYVKRK